MITVQPTRALRVDFARWAVAQTPKVRTCSTTEFALPPHLFTYMPEELLIDSLVDGHRYRSPMEDERLTAVPEVRTAMPGEAPPPVPDSAYGPDAVPPAEPENVAATDPATVQTAATAAPVAEEDATADKPACDVCLRDFKTRRGRDTHRRMAHREA
ncbi:hypothetical protein [Streptomyces milbemycinicus]|uniref:hypothetical protein n=1 Tax=Streptomyces milbemycinicus TaxID=476552 RepID=UPI001FE59E26|nr:hypothetical protein [Streptomyces milbemycinicus]